MARLIKADGTESEVHPQGKKWTLAEMQGLVGGYIEYMPGIKIRMVMDEEGKLKNKPINQVATTIVQMALLGKPLRYVPVIVGDVVIIEKGEKF